MPHQVKPRVSMQRCVTASRHCLSLSPDACARTTVPCNATSPITSKESSGIDTCGGVLRRERKHLVVEASGKSRMRAPRHCEAFLHCAFWVFCLALLHHHSIVMPRALVVMIATHDSNLIVRGAMIIGTNKQPECIVRRIAYATRTQVRTFTLLCHAHLPRPAALICTGMLSYFVTCPGTVCPRDRSRYTADAMKNEDGSVARDVSVNGVPAFQVAAL